TPYDCRQQKQSLARNLIHPTLGFFHLLDYSMVKSLLVIAGKAQSAVCVIAREPSDCGDLPFFSVIARAQSDRGDLPFFSVIAREQSDHGDLPSFPSSPDRQYT